MDTVRDFKKGDDVVAIDFMKKVKFVGTSNFTNKTAAQVRYEFVTIDGKNFTKVTSQLLDVQSEWWSGKDLTDSILLSEKITLRSQRYYFYWLIFIKTDFEAI